MSAHEALTAAQVISFVFPGVLLLCLLLPACSVAQRNRLTLLSNHQIVSSLLVIVIAFTIGAALNFAGSRLYGWLSRPILHSGWQASEVAALHERTYQKLHELRGLDNPLTMADDDPEWDRAAEAMDDAIDVIVFQADPDGVRTATQWHIFLKNTFFVFAIAGMVHLVLFVKRVRTRKRWFHGLWAVGCVCGAAIFMIAGYFGTLDEARSRLQITIEYLQRPGAASGAGGG